MSSNQLCPHHGGARFVPQNRTIVGVVFARVVEESNQRGTQKAEGTGVRQRVGESARHLRLWEGSEQDAERHGYSDVLHQGERSRVSGLRVVERCDMRAWLLAGDVTSRRKKSVAAFFGGRCDDE